MGGNMVACVVVVMFMVLAGPMAEAAITCGEVATKLQPCLGYLKSGGVVPPNCCGGIKALNSEAKTTPDKQQACTCIKSAASSMPGINYGFASSLPSKCGVSVPFAISPNVDCTKIK